MTQLNDLRVRIVEGLLSHVEIQGKDDLILDPRNPNELSHLYRLTLPLSSAVCNDQKTAN